MVDLPFKPSIAIDFDGVIHAFTQPYTKPWEILDGPTPGAKEAIQSYLDAGYRVIIYTLRVKDPLGSQAVANWLYDHAFPLELELTSEKPWSKIYIDDRGYQFTGDNWPSVVFIDKFQPWNRNYEPQTSSESGVSTDATSDSSGS